MDKLKATVKCDKCDWSQAGETVEAWHNKQCPKCNDCIIVTDKDLSIACGMDILRALGVAFSSQDTAPKDVETVDVHLDTAKL